MKMDQQKIQEMQILEQTLQNILLQKQAFEMELAETNAALKEIEKSGDEVYKVIGQLMIKKKKKEVEEELKDKEKILGLRLKNLDKQEKDLSEKSEKIREELISSKDK
jgi:prefoldin beta subunit